MDTSQLSEGNTQNMDLESLEIHIPVEAEVKRISLWSLPNSVLRRMGLPLSDAEGSRKLAESAEGIWICPAVLRRKGQKQKHENISSAMGREFQAAQSPLRMSFVSSNRAAYRALKDTMPDGTLSAHTSHTPLLTPGSAPQTSQDAVVIYDGRIYLSIRKSNRSQSQRETRKPAASQSPIPSTSGVSSKSQNKRQSPQASVEPADKELQRKRLQITLPQISSKQPKDLLTKTDGHSTTDQELLNDNRAKKKHATCMVPHKENRKDVTCKGRDVSSSKTVRSAPQSADSVHSVHGYCHRDAREEQAVWIQPQGEQEEVVSHSSDMQDLGGEEAESTNQNNDVDSNMRNDSGDVDNSVGIVEQSSNQSWTRRESQGASTSLQEEFEALAQEEMISRMKAKLRQALNNLHAS